MSGERGKCETQQKDLDSMTDLATLADKIERLTGPDRELDTLIHFSINRKWIGRIPTWPPTKIERPAMERGLAMHIEGDGYFYGDDVPHYTASLDAAMTLVPEGMSWSVTDPANADGSRSVFGHSSRCHASVEGSPNEHDYAATPALALTAAALRAHLKGNQ